MTEIKTLQDYLHWMLQFGRWDYIFRGVSNDGYEMEPSACRRLKNKSRDLSRDKLLEINKDLLRRARLQGHGKDMTDLDLLAKLQHFGAATCFLDYTFNSLVALWWACQENNPDTNGKVCAMCITVERHPEILLKQVEQEISGKDIDYFFRLDDSGESIIYFSIPDYGNSRMRAQQSILVFGDVIIPTLSECIILEDNKKSIKEELKILSYIDEEYLFPDFEGFAINNSQDKVYTELDYAEYVHYASRESALGSLDKAIEYYNKAEVCSNKLENIHYRNWELMHIYTHRGECYRRNSQFELAIQDCNSAIEIDQTYSECYYTRGMAKLGLGDYESSIEDLYQAIRIYPAHGNAYRGIWEARKKLGQYNEAVDDFDAALRDVPESLDMLFMRGEAKMELNQNCDAKLDFQAALEIARRNRNSKDEQKCLEKLEELS